MTAEMADWFRHLATVEREIRYDIERYETRAPDSDAFRSFESATHPQLAITAASKMRAAVAGRGLLQRPTASDHSLPSSRPRLAAREPGRADRLVEAPPARRAPIRLGTPNDDGGVVLIAMLIRDG